MKISSKNVSFDYEIIIKSDPTSDFDSGVDPRYAPFYHAPIAGARGGVYPVAAALVTLRAYYDSIHAGHQSHALYNLIDAWGIRHPVDGDLLIQPDNAVGNPWTIPAPPAPAPPGYDLQVWPYVAPFNVDAYDVANGLLNLQAFLTNVHEAEQSYYIYTEIEKFTPLNAAVVQPDNVDNDRG